MPRTDTRTGVAAGLASAPIVGVVRTSTIGQAERLADRFIAGGLKLIEVTFTVPDAPRLITGLLEARRSPGPPWIGAGTVTDAQRASQALAAGAEFIVSPNPSPEVASRALDAGIFLALGALTPGEILAAHSLGADIVKVYPLPPVGGPAYLATVRQPIDDVPMLAAGGFGSGEIPAYRKAGASAFGLGAQLLSDKPSEDRSRIERALALARGEQ